MRYLHLALIVVVLAACKGEPEAQVASTVAAIPYLPYPPQAVVTARSGSANAAQITFQSTQSPAEVLEYYRQSLPSTGWSLESDTEDAVGAYALYALKEGHPIWIRISQKPGAPGAVVAVSGAVVDTTKANPGASTVTPTGQ